MTTTPTRSDRGYAPGRARREQIVREATLQFGRTGFNGATILEIAARCGISRAGLLHHFRTKEALLEAVLKKRDVLDRERFRRSRSRGPDGLDVLRGMIDLADHNARQPGIIALYAVLSAEATDPAHPAHDYFVARYRRIRSGTERALERARLAGTLREGVDVADAAVALTALMDGLQVMWLLAPNEIDMAGQLRILMQRMVSVPL